MNIRALYGIIFLLLSVLLFSSCREDIIAPGNTAGNENEPVRLKNSTSYTFIINANNISTSVYDYSGISSLHSKVYLSLDDYTQGIVSFYILDYSKQPVYQMQMMDNIEPTSVSIDGRTPAIISIKFYNFTGKLNIQLYTN